MRKCKNCGKEILIAQFGLRNFCSKQCRDEHRKTYFRLNKRKQRSKINFKDVHTKGGYININPSDVHNINQEKSTTSETQKSRFEIEFGNQENYQIAKQCCNFETKQKERYCVTLHEPYYAFRKPCKECYLFEFLKADMMRQQALRKQRRLQGVQGVML